MFEIFQLLWFQFFTFRFFFFDFFLNFDLVSYYAYYCGKIGGKGSRQKTSGDFDSFAVKVFFGYFYSEFHADFKKYGFTCFEAVISQDRNRAPTIRTTTVLHSIFKYKNMGFKAPYILHQNITL